MTFGEGSGETAWTLKLTRAFTACLQSTQNFLLLMDKLCFETFQREKNKKNYKALVLLLHLPFHPLWFTKGISYLEKIGLQIGMHS